jgi:hypothetical protein
MDHLHLLTPAYVDPGSGALALQMLIAGVAGAILMLRTRISALFLRTRISTLFGKKKPGDDKPE